MPPAVLQFFEIKRLIPVMGGNFFLAISVVLETRHSDSSVKSPSSTDHSVIFWNDGRSPQDRTQVF